MVQSLEPALTAAVKAARLKRAVEKRMINVVVVGGGDDRGRKGESKEMLGNAEKRKETFDDALLE
jgi:hypothetical protein